MSWSRVYMRWLALYSNAGEYEDFDDQPEPEDFYEGGENDDENNGAGEDGDGKVPVGEKRTIVASGGMIQ